MHRVERLAAQLAHLVGLAHHVQQGEAGARADVGAQADRHPAVAGLFQAEETRAQQQVGRGAEHRRRARGLHAVERIFGGVDAVREDRAWRHQAMAGVDVEVVARAGEEFADAGDLVEVLAHVSVDQDVGMGGGDLAGHGQLGVGGGDGEARRDRIAQPSAAAPGADQAFRVGAAGLDGVGEAFGRVAVHQHLAGDQAHVARQGRFEKRVHRGLVDGSEDQGAGGPVAQQLVAEEGRGLVGVGAVGEGLFGGEGVAVQPVEQLRAPGGDDVGLRIVDVGVDEAGCDQLAGKGFDGGVFGESRGEVGIGAEGRDVAVLDDQQTVRMIGEGLRRRGAAGVVQHVDQGGSVGSAGHRQPLGRTRVRVELAAGPGDKAQANQRPGRGAAKP